MISSVNKIDKTKKTMCEKRRRKSEKCVSKTTVQFIESISRYPKIPGSKYVRKPQYAQLALIIFILSIVHFSSASSTNNRESIRHPLIYECTEDFFPQEWEDFMNSKLSLPVKNISESDENDDTNELNIKGESSLVSYPKEYWEPKIPLIGSRQQFRIQSRQFLCPQGKLRKEFHWHLRWRDFNSNYSNRPVNFSDMALMEDGSLVWNKEDAERHVFWKKDYCIWRRGKNWTSFKVCTSRESDINVRKCCPPSFIIDAVSKECDYYNPRWLPMFYKNITGEKVAPQNTSIVYGFPNCKKKYVINSNPKNNFSFKLLLNGTLVLIDGSKRTFIGQGEFCIDGINYGESTDATRKREKVDTVLEWDQVVIACKPTTYKWDIDKWRIPLYSTLNCISALFLLFTDTVYILLWRHQNIHGWLQFSYATSLLFTFNCFVVVQRWSEQLLAASGSLCKIMGWITHLTYLSAFFWLTSMNFDLWWRFSRPLKSTRNHPQEKKWKRFLGFAGFSIGIPLLISSVGITLDYVYDEMLLDPPFTVPGFGKEKCYFESKRSQVPYLYFPAGILLLVDLSFFTSTVRHLRKMHAHTELARTQSTAMEDKKGLRIIAKLFIVMGVLWVFELASWIAHILLPDKEIMLIWIFIPIDILNSLQGVAIFFIFVCKPKVRNQLLAIFKKHETAKACALNNMELF